MINKVIDNNFFNRETDKAAKDLLGKFLVRKIGNKETALMITEVEVYDGFEDKASHAFKGRTKRTEVMFSEAGTFYIYLCYGRYFMLNIVTREKDYPAAILIRGAKNNEVNLNGPGKLTKFLKINKNLNNKTAQKDSALWLEDRGIKIIEKKIKETPRIGVSYAGPIWSKKKLRFILEI